MNYEENEKEIIRREKIEKVKEAKRIKLLKDKYYEKNNKPQKINVYAVPHFRKYLLKRNNRIGKIETKRKDIYENLVYNSKVSKEQVKKLPTHKWSFTIDKFGMKNKAKFELRVMLSFDYSASDNNVRSFSSTFVGYPE